jgi:threonine dehydrogenase-like Zn-dependent dehydrogenase
MSIIARQDRPDPVNATSREPQVVVAGCGPTGLWLANELGLARCPVRA